jgi:hypothetical protein
MAARHGQAHYQGFGVRAECNRPVTDGGAGPTARSGLLKSKSAQTATTFQGIVRSSLISRQVSVAAAASISSQNRVS